MRVKTYRGPDSKSVLDRIKAELGPDAVILGTRNCKDNGQDLCEITAALEQKSSSPVSGGTQQQQGFDPTEQQNGPAEHPQSQGWGQWHQEWSQIKEHLVTLLRPQMDMHQLSPIQRQSLEYMEREGVDAHVILELFNELKSNPQTSVLTPLERIIRTKAWTQQNWPQKFHAFSGPCGAGKTLAMIRMALAMKNSEPDLRLCLVNTDQERLNNRLILKHYAQLADITYKEIAGSGDFEDLVAESHLFDKIFIDLAGLDRGKTLERITGKLGLDEAQDLQIHLVICPHYSQEQMNAFKQQYYSPLAASVIWTKLDEACIFGAIVNMSKATELPVSALSYGTGLTDTLAPAQHILLWKLIFKHKLPSEL